MTITVLLVDDQRLVREAVGELLAREPDIEVVGEAGDAASAFERARELKPDLVVMDIGLPDMSGIEAAARLKEQPEVDAKVVALSVQTNRRFVTEMLRAGACAYVTKSSAFAELVHAIRSAASGLTYLCPEVAGTLVSAMRDGPEQGKARRLTRREHEVLRMIALGRRSPMIARQLSITPGTVDVYRRNIMSKTGVRTVAELTRYAIREGLITA